MEHGNRLDRLTHRLLPDDALIEIGIFNLNKAVNDTRHAVESGAEVILAAVFCFGWRQIIAYSSMAR
jgi:hypothetical protein